MDISLDDRSLHRPVQGRTAAEFQRLKEEDKLRRLAPAGQIPAAKASIRQPSHGHLKTKEEAEHNAAYWVLLKMDISLDDRSLQRAVQGRTAAELQRLKERDKLRVLSPAGQMPAARALIQQPSAKPGSAPLKAPPPLKATEGQEVKPVLIPLNAVVASKSVSKANDN